MLILDATTTKIQASMAGAVTTTNPDYFASYVDVTTTTFTSAQSNGALNGVTQVDMIAAPSASTQRQVKYISIFNRDSVSQTITVVVDVSGTDRTIYRGALLSNEMLQYVDGEGWSTIDANGNRKFVSTNITAAQSISFYEPAAVLTASAFQQGSLYLQHVSIPANFNPDVGMIALILAASSSAGGTISINMGAYSYNGNSISLASSTMRTIGFNSTAAASSATRVTGTKFWSIPTGTWNMTPGDYIIGIAMSATTSATSGTFSFYFNRSGISINGSEFGGGTGNVTNPLMFGRYSAATNTLPNSIALSEVIQSGSGTNFAQTPWFCLVRSS